MKKKVEFESEDSTIVGNLFLPDSLREGDTLPALVSAGPMTGVKEQVAGLYAERMAKGGFISLAFDHRHFGESEGWPRQHEDPAKKVEDLKNAISFLTTLTEVDAEHVGAFGVSMGGGYVLQLAAFDRRVKAVAIIAAGLNIGDTLSGMLGKDGFVEFLRNLNMSRQRHYTTGEIQYIPAVATGNRPAAMVGDEPFEYYGTSRAWSPYWFNRYTTESVENLMAYNAVPFAHHVSPTPLLIVHGKNDRYCLPRYSQEVYDQAGEPKEMLWLDAPNHIDLYDIDTYVDPIIDRMVAFYRRYL
jgi:fermentation-respiration switch protein FrsA (DUF1100 family)